MKAMLMAGILSAVMAVSGCAVSRPEVADPLATATTLAAGADMRRRDFPGDLPLASFVRTGDTGGRLAVYIEGDGRAWIDRDTPSSDPTPRNPVALRLAVLDPSRHLAYLARPGQYNGGNVAPEYWLGARFAPEVVAAMTAAIQVLLTETGATAVDLAGYSGGGALAVLVAEQLQISRPAMPLTLRTVAGNLDHQAWTRRKRLTPLARSQNPADVAASLARVPQRHYTGLQDRQVPPYIIESYLQRVGSDACVEVIRVDAGHAGPWEAAWREELAARLPACR